MEIKENSYVYRRTLPNGVIKYVITIDNGDDGFRYTTGEGDYMFEAALKYIEEHPLLVRDEQIVIPEPTLDDIKNNKLGQLESDRHAVVNQGTTLASGVKIPTDEDTRKLLTEFSVAAQDDGLLNVKLPLGNGEFLSLENNEIAGVQSVIMEHVSEAIELEARLAERVKEAETPEDVEKVKWPEDSGDLDGGEILRASLFIHRGE